MMKMELQLPGEVKVGEDYDIVATGMEPGFYRVSVTYTHRSEMYKAMVADEGKLWLTERVEQGGHVAVIVWDWTMLHPLLTGEFEAVDTDG